LFAIIVAISLVLIFATSSAAKSQSSSSLTFVSDGECDPVSFDKPAGRYTSILPSFVLKSYGKSESGQPDLAVLKEMGYEGRPFWKPAPPKKIRPVDPEAGAVGRIFMQPKIDEAEPLYGESLTKLEKELIGKGQVSGLTGPAKALFLGASRGNSNRRGF